MRAIVLILALGAAFEADAIPIHIDFKFQQTEPASDLPPEFFSGSWSYDDSIAKPGGIFEDVFFGMVLDSFEFSWLGHEWSPSNARLARIEFDQEGVLRSWIIGGTAISGGCAQIGFLDCVGTPTTSNDFYLSATRLTPDIAPPELVAAGVWANRDDFASGEGGFTIRGTEVPTPGSLVLFGSALLGMSLFSRRRQ
jgi:hypothetical protein